MKLEFGACSHCGKNFADNEERINIDMYCMPVCTQCYQSIKFSAGEIKTVFRFAALLLLALIAVSILIIVLG